jgi:hypothetical protein
MTSSLPPVAILLLRGLEGCGVTTYCRHFKAYYDYIGAKCEIFVLNDKKIGRADTSTDLPINEFKFDSSQDIVDRINSNFEISLVFSVPAKSSSEEAKAGYVPKILQKLKTSTWMVNLDHHVLSFSRNANYKEAIESCRGVLCYSLNETKSGFIGWLRKNNVNAPVRNLDNFFHIPRLDGVMDMSREGREKRLINAARAVAWKRGSLVLNLHKPLARRGFVTEMIGFERSIAGWSQLKNYDGQLNWFTTDDFYKPVKGASAFSSARVNNELFDYVDAHGQDPDLMYVFGSYDYNRGLKRVAQSAFATHPRSFEQNRLCYGNNFEFQGLEAALLSVPIFHRHFLSTVTLPGDSTTTLKDTGVFLSIDDDNRHLKQGGPQVLDVEAFVDNLNAIWNDQKSYRSYREKSVEFVQKYYSSEVVVPKLVSIVN